MDYLSIREDTTLELSRMQRAQWDEYMKTVEKPKELAAGQRVLLEGEEHVVQTLPNYARLRGWDLNRAMAAFRRHPDLCPLVWLIPLPEERSEPVWRAACDAYGGLIPAAGDLSVPLPECLWVGDRFEVDGQPGIVYLSGDGPKLLVR